MPWRATISARSREVIDGAIGLAAVYGVYTWPICALIAGVTEPAVAATPVLGQSEHYVRPHYDKKGHFIQGHMQTNPDGNRINNWSTQGNVNP